jgi:hypothetical protein
LEVLGSNSHKTQGLNIFLRTQFFGVKECIFFKWLLKFLSKNVFLGEGRVQGGGDNLNTLYSNCPNLTAAAAILPTS